MTTYRITDWQDLYEPPKRENSGDGPLRYVKSQVHGHSLGDGYRMLLDAGGDQGMAAFGLFQKLLELAADEPRHLRDGTIRRQGRPATDADIAFLVGVSEPASVTKWLGVLSQVGWIAQNENRRDDDGSRRDADATPTRRAGKPSPIQGQGQGQETGTETETDTETKTGTGDADDGAPTTPVDDPRPPVAASPVPAPAPDCADEPYVPCPAPDPACETQRQRVYEGLIREFGIPVAARKDPTPNGRRIRADLTTLHRLLLTVVHSRGNAAKTEADDLLQLARSLRTKPPPQRIGAFIGECKERYPSVAAMWNGGAARNGATTPTTATGPAAPSPPIPPRPAHLTSLAVSSQLSALSQKGAP